MGMHPELILQPRPLHPDCLQRPDQIESVPLVWKPELDHQAVIEPRYRHVPGRQTQKNIGEFFP
jgi:hypothetical protein